MGSQLSIRINGRLKELLERRKKAIVDRWIEAIHHTYPPETAQFLEKEPNKIANPIGASIQESVWPLFDQLLSEERDPVEVKRRLDTLIRIRSVQDFSPASATQVIFALKDAVRAEILGAVAQEGLVEAYLAFESEIDRFASLAFDVYMECRERIWHIRMEELKRNPDITAGGMCFSYMIRRGKKHLERLAKEKTQH